MIQILSWNIQNGEGVDGKISLNRIADTIFSMATPDVICLQEVSRNSTLKDNTKPDQLKQLSNLFLDYEAFYGPALRCFKGWREPKRAVWQYHTFKTTCLIFF